MSIKPSQEALRFTRPTLTLRDYLELTGADPETYCKIAQPKECQGNISEDLKNDCSKIFDSCMEFAKQFEHWYRSN